MKMLNYVLYLNKILFRFGKVETPLCSFCKSFIRLEGLNLHKTSGHKLKYSLGVLFFGPNYP